MKCPECERKIGFLESLTIVNPLNFKCKKCNNYITLSRHSIRIYLFILLIVFFFFVTGFYFMNVNSILGRQMFIMICPLILTAVVLIHYFYWNSATGTIKSANKNDSTGISC